MHKAVIKIVFTNNVFKECVDIFSLPVISAILTSPNLPPEDHLHYERGSDYPHNLRNTFRRGDRIQYELVELVYRRCQRAPGDTPPTREPKRRRRIHTPATSGLEVFRKEITYCVLQNSGLLHLGNRQTNRFCYVNSGDVNMYGVSSSRPPLALQDFLDGVGPTKPGTVGGYVKIFSNAAKRSYLESLNYRHLHQPGVNDKFPAEHSLPHLQNHLIVYFDVQKYYVLNNAYIFYMPQLKRACNINCHFGGRTGPVKACAKCMPRLTARDTAAREQLFARLQHMLNKQVESIENDDATDDAILYHDDVSVNNLV